MAASARQLPVASELMDVVISLDVMQRLPLDGGDVVALRERLRVLRPGGVEQLHTNAQSSPHADDNARYAYHKCAPDEMRAKLVAGGFAPLRVGRLNAVLKLADVPREYAARKYTDGHYVALLAKPANSASLGWRLKRGWLRLEAAALARGWNLRIGRTILALARKPADSASRDGLESV